MQSTKNLLAFDIGPSSGRTIVGKFDGNTVQLEEVYRFSNDPQKINNHFFWDILRLFHEIKVGLGVAFQGGEKNPVSVGIDTWGVDYALLDQSDMLMQNPYTYRDGRTNNILPEVFKKVPKKEIYYNSGNKSIPSIPSTSYMQRASSGHG